MGVFNPDTWEQQWAAFMKYPYIMAVGVAITAVVVWWFRGFQIKIFKDRLGLAAEKVELADRARGDVEKQFDAYKEEVAAGAGSGALAERLAKVEAAIKTLSTANNAVRSVIEIGARISAGSSMRAEAKAPAAGEERPK